MRLTLRTLLAYVDEILEPADREELAKKVESSDFAHDLIHRTKDTMRRLRLSAPQVVGTGMGLDPNTVAEYLDNVLPPDSVADFERICLESDVHLAEVASAHHVLTMVLGEPAEVDPAARQRMYGIPTEAEHRKHLRIEPAHSGPTSPHEPVAVTPPPHVFPPASVAPAAHTRSDSVPDYLRASAWTRHGTLLAACAAVLLLAVSWIVYVSMPGWFGGVKQVADGSGNSKAADAHSPAIPNLESPAVPKVETSELPAPPPVAIEEVTESEPAEAPIAAPPRLLLPAMGSVSPPTPPSTETVRIEAEPTDLASSASIPPVVPDVIVPDAIVPDVIVPKTVAPDPGLEPPVADIPPVDDVEIAAALPAEPIELGTYLDGKNILLWYEPESAAWYRMTPRTTLHPGDRLLALPAFFPKLMLVSGLHVKLVGGSMITLGPAVAGSNEPAIIVDYGKVVLVNTSNEENGLQLTVAGETANVRLGRSATLAISAAPKHEPGRDPRELPAPVVAEVFARDGEVGWSDATGTGDIAAPGRWTIEDGLRSTVSADATFPDWIDQEPVEQLSEKMFGAPAVETALEPTRPVEGQLLELYQSSRRREVKSLVARSSVYAGLFVPFVEALRDSDQKSSWATHIDTLRGAMALGPASAEKIYQTLVDQRGKAAADDLYEMLCGYSAEQIGSPEEFQGGLAARLVDWMENDSLDYRVLAVQSMGDITGMRLMSNPAGSPTERARGIRLWRQRLKAGEVAPVTR